MAKITTAYLKTQIPTWISDAKLAELKEVWDENNEDMDDDDERAAIDFPAHVRDPKNWKRISKRKMDGEWIRMFELTPGPIFEGIFICEVLTDGADQIVKQVCITDQ